jgi:hypothetical protein
MCHPQVKDLVKDLSGFYVGGMRMNRATSEFVGLSFLCHRGVKTGWFRVLVVSSSCKEQAPRMLMELECLNGGEERKGQGLSRDF